VSQYKKGDIEVLEKVQKKATKVIPEIRHLPYKDRLKVCKLPALHYRQVRGDIIEMYKILTCKYNADVQWLNSAGMTFRHLCLAFHHLKLPFHHLKLSFHHLAMPFHHHNKVFVICNKLVQVSRFQNGAVRLFMRWTLFLSVLQ